MVDDPKQANSPLEDEGRGGTMSDKRDTYKYRQKIGNKTVGFGITKNLDRREQQHQGEDPRVHCCKEGNMTTEEAARNWEKEKTIEWEKTHGRLPGKNKRRGG
jgi:predicted GIY-YIG superfamily endonuclease